jgi:hypothetical protein
MCYGTCPTLIENNSAIFALMLQGFHRSFWIWGSRKPARRQNTQYYRAMFGKEPDMPTTFGYAGIEYFRIAAEKVGRDLTREKFIDALETFRNVSEGIFGQAPVTYTPTSHQGAFEVFMSQVKGGKFVKISGFLDFRK